MLFLELFQMHVYAGVDTVTKCSRLGFCFLLLQRFRKLKKPSPKWGPRKEEYRREYEESLQKEVLPLYDSNIVKRKNTGAHDEESRSFLPN